MGRSRSSASTRASSPWQALLGLAVVAGRIGRGDLRTGVPANHGAAGHRDWSGGGTPVATGTQLDALGRFTGSGTIVTAGVLIDPFPKAAAGGGDVALAGAIAVGFVVGRWVESWFHADGGGPHVQIARRIGRTFARAQRVAVISLIAWVWRRTMGGEEMPLLKGQILFRSVSRLWLAMIASLLFRLNSPVLAARRRGARHASGAYLFAGPDLQVLEAARKAGSYVTLRPIVVGHCRLNLPRWEQSGCFWNRMRRIS